MPQNRKVSHESSSAVNQQAKPQETPQTTPNTKAEREKNMQNIENKISAIDKAIADMNAVKPRSIDILGQPPTLPQEQETAKITPSAEIEKEKKPKIQKIEKKSKSNDYKFGR